LIAIGHYRANAVDGLFAHRRREYLSHNVTLPLLRIATCIAAAGRLNSSSKATNSIRDHGPSSI
jgi:hypothetical protein